MPDPFKLVDVTKFDDIELGHLLTEALRNKNMRLYTACLKEFNRRRDAAKKHKGDGHA